MIGQTQPVMGYVMPPVHATIAENRPARIGYVTPQFGAFGLFFADAGGPAGTVVPHKNGNQVNATHDTGVVVSPDATYVAVVLSDYGFTEGGASRIARISRDVYD